MADEAAIANLALGRLRVGQRISALSDQSTAAGYCDQFFDQCRQEVLRAFPWPCTLRAEALAQVSGQSFPGWSYVYQYPANCLMVRCVADESGMRVAQRYLFSDPCNYSQYIARFPWQSALKDDEASQVILSDVSSAWVYYTVNVTNVGIYPPDLVSCIADRLAMEVGGPLQADSAMIDRAERRYSISLSTASAQAMNEQREDARPDSPSISCRE